MTTIIVYVENQTEPKYFEGNKGIECAQMYKSCLTQTKPAACLIPGDCILVNGVWYTVKNTRMTVNIKS